MTDTLSFPGLGLELNINPVVFHITGNWSIRWYGVIFAVAFLSAATYIFRRVKDFGLDEDRVIDVLLGSVLGGIVGARLYYVLFSWDTYRNNLLSILRIWEGGIAMYGSIIGGVLVGILLCRWRKVKLFPMMDLAAGGLLVGQAIGRWGNFVNMEAFGTNTTLPWGMTSNTITAYLIQVQDELARSGIMVDPSMPVHPTFFYESIWCLIGFLLLMWYTSKRRFDGELSLLYIGWYGMGRFFIEGLRTDSLMLGSLRVSQLVALVCVVVSVILTISIHSKIRRSGDPDYLRLYVDTDEGRAVLAGTFYPKEEKRAKDTHAQPENTAEDPTPQEQPSSENPSEQDTLSDGLEDTQPAPDTEK